MDEYKLITQLKIDEGRGPLSSDGMSCLLYQDKFGNWTIGFGRNLSAEGITINEAQTLLMHDITSHESDLSRSLPWWHSLNDARQNALANMCFNLGIEKLLTFTTFLNFMEQGEFQNAAHDLQNTEWYGQVGDRAHRIMLLIQSGEFPV